MITVMRLPVLRPHPHVRREFRRDDVARTIRGTAMAWVLPKIVEVVAVVEGDFLARADIAVGNDPDAAVDQLGIAIRRATVVQEARRIPVHAAVKVEVVVEEENKLVVPAKAA